MTEQHIVIPAKAGIQAYGVDSRLTPTLRGNDRSILIKVSERRKMKEEG